MNNEFTRQHDKMMAIQLKNAKLCPHCDIIYDAMYRSNCPICLMEAGIFIGSCLGLSKNPTGEEAKDAFAIPEDTEDSE